MKNIIILLLFFLAKMHGQIISTAVGNGMPSFNGDGGQASAAELQYPSGIAFDRLGNLYIADVENYRIRKVTTAGIISTVAGNGINGYAGDGGLATAAELNFPYGVALYYWQFVHS